MLRLTEHRAGNSKGGCKGPEHRLSQSAEKLWSSPVHFTHISVFGEEAPAEDLPLERTALGFNPTLPFVF